MHLSARIIPGRAARACGRGLLGVAIGAGLLSPMTGCGDASASRTPAVAKIAELSPQTPTPFRFFADSSVFNSPLAAAAPIDPHSSEIVTALDREVAREEREDERTEHVPWINIDTTSYSVPIYTVPQNQPTVRVRLKGGKARTLQEAWNAVPLPAGAKPARGTDGHLVVWQPSSDKLWEFWRLVDTSEGWVASWGGAMQHVSHSSGVYGPRSWPGAEGSWGGSASSLSIAGGVITLEDLRAGEINHALAMAVPHIRAEVYALPAQRTDGKSANSFSLPEGAHLRLDPSLDLTSLHLPHLILMIAEAAQRYGFLVRDGAPVVTLYGQDPEPTGANPYLGPHGYFEGKLPRELLATFPWRHLELLHMKLRSASGARHRRRNGERK